MMIMIPQEKIDKLKLLLQPLLHKTKINFKQLESLTGLMAFCSKALPSERALIRRFYDVLASVKVQKSYHKVRVTNEIRYDAVMWLEFLNNFNGVCYFPEKEWVDRIALPLFTDSTGNENLGCGAYADGEWAQLRWPCQ
jgi:hypothetical protein